MKFSKLLLYSGLAILGFWLLGWLLKLAAWLIHVALFIGVILVIISLINQYLEGKRSK